MLMWRQLPTLGEPERFRGWLYRIATNRCMSVLRLRAPRQTLPAPEENLDREAAGTDPADQAEAAVGMQDLDGALRDLPDEQRICWVLREMHDLSYDEIARSTGQPVSTVRGRIARARKALAVRMSPWT